MVADHRRMNRSTLQNLWPPGGRSLPIKMRMPSMSQDKWQVLGCGHLENKKGGLSQSSLPFNELTLNLICCPLLFLPLACVGGQR